MAEEKDIVSREELVRNLFPLGTDDLDYMVSAKAVYNAIMATSAQEPILQIAASYSLDSLNLSARTYNPLSRCTGIKTVADLMGYSTFELQNIQMLGKKGIAEIQSKLAAFVKDHNQTFDQKMQET